MAIEFVGGAQAGKVGATSGNSTIALNSGLTGGIASAVAAGDLVVAVFATGSTANRTLAITDGTNPYTLIGSELYQDDVFDTNLRVAYKFMGGTPDTSTTFGPTGNAADSGAMAVYVFRGVDPTTPLDVAAVTGQAANTSRVVPPDITPSTAGAFPVVVGAAAHNGGVDTFTSSDLTDFQTIGGANDTNDVTLGIGHDPAWSSGATNYATWGHSQADSADFSWAAITFALRPAPSTIVGDVLQVTETDLAQAMGKSKVKAVGQNTETDLAQAISPSKTVVVQQISETDLAQAIAWAPKARMVGQVAETDLAQQMSAAKTLSFTQASETDVAQEITPALTGGGQIIAVGQAQETNLAQAMVSLKALSIGQVEETDLAQPMAWDPKARLLGQALEVDQAMDISPVKSTLQTGTQPARRARRGKGYSPLGFVPAATPDAAPAAVLEQAAQSLDLEGTSYDVDATIEAGVPDATVELSVGIAAAAVITYGVADVSADVGVHLEPPAAEDVDALVDTFAAASVATQHEAYTGFSVLLEADVERADGRRRPVTDEEALAALRILDR